MRRAGVAADTITYESAVLACEVGHLSTEALQLLCSMHWHRLAPTAEVYGRTLAALSLDGLWRPVATVMQELGRNHIALEQAGLSLAL